jgi:hypothetical protein
VNREKLEQQIRMALNGDVDRALPSRGLVDEVMPRLDAPPRKTPWQRLFPRSRVAWALLPAGAMLIAALLLWQPWSSDSADRVMARAQAALSELRSYRASMVVTEGTGATYGARMEFAAQDRYHETYAGSNDDYSEFIVIENQTYGKGIDASSIGSSFGIKARTAWVSSMLTREAASRTLDYLKDVKRFPDEEVDGTDCLHYRGTVDFEKQYRAAIQSIQETNASKGLPPLSKEAQERMINEARSIPGSETIDMWIGKSDDLMRKMKQEVHGPDPKDLTQQVVVEFTYFDFNASIAIEAPLDEKGQLLPGWTLASP